jgi:hypothetical protein
MKKKSKILLILIIFTVINSGCSNSKSVNEQMAIIAQNEEVKKVTDPVIIEKEEEPEKPLNEISNIFNTRPISVMIDNHTDARPQSGISQAKVVYEILAEGLITRYMAVFEELNGVVGPIRSARPYFVQLSTDFNSYFVHYGGSPDALEMLKKKEFINVDGINASTKYFWRDGSRKAPHNVYSNMESILEYKSSNIEPYAMRNDWLTNSINVPVEGNDVTKLKIVYKEPTSSDITGYYVEYVYNGEKSSFDRYVNSGPFIDKETNEQLDYSNIIVQFATHKILDSYGRRDVGVIGSGNGYYINNGKLVNLTWEKVDNLTPTVYKVNGEQLVFNPGNIFIQIIQNESQINIE